MYKTKDFYLGCCFISKGIKLINSEKDGVSNTVFFTFDIENKEEKLKKIIDDFINQKCYVNVKKFTYAMKVLRNELNKYN